MVETVEILKSLSKKYIFLPKIVSSTILKKKVLKKIGQGRKEEGKYGSPVLSLFLEIVQLFTSPHLENVCIGDRSKHNG